MRGSGNSPLRRRTGLQQSRPRVGRRAAYGQRYEREERNRRRRHLVLSRLFTSCDEGLSTNIYVCVYRHGTRESDRKMAREREREQHCAMLPCDSKVYLDYRFLSGLPSFFLFTCDHILMHQNASSLSSWRNIMAKRYGSTRSMILFRHDTKTAGES